MGCGAGTASHFISGEKQRPRFETAFSQACSIYCLNEYLRRTEQRREEDQTKTRLSLIVVKPYKPAVKSTIARWMKMTIHEAGIGELFSAHSVRGPAATAAHMKGMAVSDILSIADWSSDNVFKAFYYRPTEERPRSLLDTLPESEYIKGRQFVSMLVR